MSTQSTLREYPEFPGAHLSEPESPSGSSSSGALLAFALATTAGSIPRSAMSKLDTNFFLRLHTRGHCE